MKLDKFYPPPLVTLEKSLETRDTANKPRICAESAFPPFSFTLRANGEGYSPLHPGYVTALSGLMTEYEQCPSRRLCTWAW